MLWHAHNAVSGSANGGLRWCGGHVSLVISADTVSIGAEWFRQINEQIKEWYPVY